MLTQYLEAARDKARRADQESNEWPLDDEVIVDPHVTSWVQRERADYSGADMGSSPPTSATTQSAGCPSPANEASLDAECLVLSWLGSCELSDRFHSCMQEDGKPSFALESCSAEGRNLLLDDHSWSILKKQIKEKEREQGKPSGFRGLIAVPTFTTFTTKFRSSLHPYGKPEIRGKTKELVRQETALDLRLLWMIWFIFTQALPALITVPCEDDFDMFHLPEFVSLKAKLYSMKGLAANRWYTTYSTHPLNAQAQYFEELSSHYDHLVAFEPMPLLSSSVKAQLRHRLSHLQRRHRQGALEQDGLRKPISQTIGLRGRAGKTDKQKEDELAIGGMRQPRK